MLRVNRRFVVGSGTQSAPPNKGLQLSTARLALPVCRGVWHPAPGLRRCSGGPGSRS
jgi:hypothetical protein